MKIDELPKVTWSDEDIWWWALRNLQPKPVLYVELGGSISGDDDIAVIDGTQNGIHVTRIGSKNRYINLEVKS